MQWYYLHNRDLIHCICYNRSTDITCIASPLEIVFLQDVDAITIFYLSKLFCVVLALSLGKMYFFVFGNHNRYFFCESGAAVKDAKDAEALSKSGDIIVSPYMWSYCVEKDYSYTMLEDGKHAKVLFITVTSA